MIVATSIVPICEIFICVPLVSCVRRDALQWARVARSGRYNTLLGYDKGTPQHAAPAGLMWPVLCVAA
jgi:adenylylsulfate kinase-like enzyme